MHPVSFLEIKARQDLYLLDAMENHRVVRKQIKRHPIQALGELLIGLGFKLYYGVYRVNMEFDETSRIMRISA